MPELPGGYLHAVGCREFPTDRYHSEVERARKLIEDSLKGYKIKSVDAKEDKIVYTGGTDHAEFVRVEFSAGVGDMSR
jgi:hypothetical protein